MAHKSITRRASECSKGCGRRTRHKVSGAPMCVTCELLAKNATALMKGIKA